MKEIRKVIIKTLIAVWCLSGGSLSLMLNGYATDVPVAKYIFTVLESLDGRGMELLFALLGTGVLFYLVRDRQKNLPVSGLSAFFAVCTVFGISYEKTDSWDCIFLFGNQFLFAVFTMVGFYLLYKNCILFVGYIFEHKKEWLNTESGSRLGKLLFEEHPFIGPLVFLLISGLPWLVAFFPGTLQWDAHGQLWMTMGAIEQTSYHPVFITNYMGGCIKLGRTVFGSDSVGLLFYCLPQFISQCLVFSYVLTVMKRLKTPVLFRYGALCLWGVFPYFQIWGYTMVKDTPYYVAFVLLMAVVVDVLNQSQSQKYHYVLIALAASVMALARNDGRYVLVIGLVMLLISYRRYWRVWTVALLCCVSFLVVEERIYMPMAGIGKGPAGEMLSIPLQQTARYLRDHYEEVTPKEAAVLQKGFEVPLEKIGGRYHPMISDSVKGAFVDNPDSEYLKQYFQVWFAQFRKHPDTYVQAFLNQIYGYFYPNCPNYGDYLTVTYLGNADYLKDDYLDLKFSIENDWLREFLRHVIYTTEKMPGLSLLYGCGIYTYLLLGAAVGLLGRKKWRQLTVLAPAFCVLLICMVSPVNGYLRYMMPVMAALPVWGSWCYQVMTETADAKDGR